MRAQRESHTHPSPVDVPCDLRFWDLFSLGLARLGPWKLRGDCQAQIVGALSEVGVGGGRRAYLLVSVIPPHGPEHSSDEFRSINQSVCSLCSLPAAIFSLV